MDFGTVVITAEGKSSSRPLDLSCNIFSFDRFADVSFKQTRNLFEIYNFNFVWVEIYSNFICIYAKDV